MDDLTRIREACAQLRRLPEPQWSQAPRLPLGARSPHVSVPIDGKTVEAWASEWASTLMATDAELRGAQRFTITAQRLALPDVIEALAKSLAASHDARATECLAGVADGMHAIYG